jgi:hypothetical protein
MRMMKKTLGVLALLLDLGLIGCVNGVIEFDDDWHHHGDKEASAVFQETVSLNRQVAVRVLGANGSVKIWGVAGAESVVIDAVRRVRSDTYRDAEARLSDLTIEVHARSSHVEIKTVQPEHTGGRTYLVDYEITVPVHLMAEVLHGNGLVRIENLASDVDVKNGNGDVVLDAIAGSTWVSLGNGSVRADIDLPHGGQIRHSVGNGSISLGVQDMVSATFGAKVGNGTISMTGLDLQNPVSTPRQLRGILGAGNGIIDLNLGNGQIRVAGG